MEIKDSNGNDIKLKYVEAKPQKLSKEQLQRALSFYMKALEIACEGILFERGDFCYYGFDEKRQPGVMYRLDQANEVCSKKEV